MTDFCVVWGPIIATLVMFLKKIPFVASLDPKWLVAGLSIVAVVLPLVIKGELAGQLLAIVACVVATFGVAVGTFEVGKSVLAKKVP